jgi:hypothetical protein
MCWKMKRAAFWSPPLPFPSHLSLTQSIDRASERARARERESAREREALRHQRELRRAARCVGSSQQPDSTPFGVSLDTVDAPKPCRGVRESPLNTKTSILSGHCIPWTSKVSCQCIRSKSGRFKSRSWVGSPLESVI